jgi:hypothetical protein
VESSTILRVLIGRREAGGNHGPLWPLDPNRGRLHLTLLS